MKNTKCLKLCLKQRPDKPIVHHAHRQMQGSISSHPLNYHRTGGKLIRILMITTPTLSRFTVLFCYHISPTGGVNKRKCTQTMVISPMWHSMNALSYQMVSDTRTWGQLFPWARCYLLEAVKNHRWYTLRNSCPKAVCWSQWPSIGYNEDWKLLGNEDRCRGQEVAQNGQFPWGSGEVAEQPKPRWLTEGISHSKSRNDTSTIHFRY